MSRWEGTAVRTCAAFIGKVYCMLCTSEIGCFLLRHLMSKLVKVLLYVHRNRRLIGDGEPRTPTSTFTQLLSSVSVLVEVLLYVHRNRRLIRDGSPGRPPRLSHSS